MKKDSLEKKIAAYVTLAAAYLAAHPVDADAQIMYTDVNPDTLIYSNQPGYGLDLNNDGVTDFVFYQSTGSNTYINSNGCTGSYSHWMNIEGTAIGSNKFLGSWSGTCLGPVALNFGDIIGNQGPFTQNGLLSHGVEWGGWSGCSYGYNGTYFNGCFFGNDKYVGLKLVSGGNTYYGWARLNTGWFNSPTVLKDYAVQMIPDSSIQAGDTSGCVFNNLVVTPSPSSTNINYLCTSDSLEIGVSGANGNLIQWLWNNQPVSGANDSVFWVSDTGIYSLTVTTINCNYSFDSILVSAIPSNIITGSFHTDEYCGSADAFSTVNVFLDPALYTYSWSNGETTQAMWGLSAGTYFVTVTDMCGTSNVDSVTIQNIPGPTLNALHTNACANQAIGEATALVTNGTPPYHYDWSTGSSNATISNLLPGNYQVTVTDNNNCADTLYVTIENNTPVLSALNDSICIANTGEINLIAQNGSGIYSYHWNTGETTEDLAGLNAGTYSVTVTDSSGCSSALSVFVINTSLQPTISVSNQILYSSYSGKNQWYLDSLTNPLAGDTLNYLIPPVNGFYWVEAIYPNGCSNISNKVHIGFVTGIENTDVPFVSTIVDNKKLLFHLADNSLMGNQIDILNGLGQLVATVTITNQTPEADLSALPAGIYFYHIRSKQKTYSGKFFIE